MDNDYPLQQLRVVEIGGDIATAYTAKMLADAGAEVVRVEPPSGDPLRRRKASTALDGGAPLAEGETGALFHFLNGNKASACVDLARADGRAALFHLCSNADLVIDGGTLASTGFDAGELRERFQALSIVAISNWGSDGPFATRAANEFTLQAEVGSTAYRGYSDRPPFAAGGRLGDYLCGTYAAVAALSAWRAARGSGRGQLVEVSRFEVMLLSFQPYQYIHGQLEPGLVPRSVDVPSIEPARDGFVGFCTITDQQWRSFAEMIGHPEMGDDPELITGFHRFMQIDRVAPAIHGWTMAHSVDEIIAEASKRRIPVAPVGNGKTVCDMEHLIARDAFWDNPAGFVQPRPPYRFSKGAVRRPAAAPAAGSAPADTAWARRTARPPVHSDTALALTGIRVLDFTAFWAGPVATACFAALGADVIKVESIQRPDGMRFAGGIFPKDKPVWECSPITHGANPGKRGLTLDLNQPRGLELVRELVPHCDIVMENFSPRVMEQFGLGFDTISRLNPEALMVRMPAFGIEGPWRDRTGFAMTIEQVSGLAWLTGYPDRPPVVPRGCVDPLGGMNAVFATLCALELRETGAGGQLVEVPLIEAGLHIAAEQIIEYSAYGKLVQRHANRGCDAVPQGVFECSDGGMIALSIETDAQWQVLVDTADDSALADLRHTDMAGRREHEDMIEQALAGWTRSFEAEQLATRLAEAGVPAALLRNVRELQRHPQLAARRFFTRFNHAVVGDIDYPNFPFRIDGKYLRVQRPAPLLGEHNREILTDLLGLDDDGIKTLERAEVIGDRPAFPRQ